MLIDFKDKQELAYNLFVKDIENKCLTHAYLIDENNYADAYMFVMSFVKAILCDKYSEDNHDNCCSFCKRIDDGNYTELKIIVPDGMYIKKQQIIELQQEFSRSMIEGKKRVYIIRDCDKMRAEAANSMLKFLEEPEDDIIAILMTNNINSVLSTIISRCKVIKLSNDSNQVYDRDELIESVALDFVTNVENKGIDALLDVKDIWFSKISSKEKEKMLLAFDIMIDIYYDVMKIIIGSKNIKFSNWLDKISGLVKGNKYEDIVNKINILVDAKDSIKYNVNSSLLIDSVIISIGGVTNGSRY